MSFTAQGDEIKGEVVSADASAGVALTLYDRGANAGVTRTQLPIEFLTITDILLISTDGGAYNLVFFPLGGAIVDGAGLRISLGVADVHGGLAHTFETPITGPKGYGAALIAAAGNVDLVITGNLSKV